LPGSTAGLGNLEQEAKERSAPTAQQIEDLKKHTRLRKHLTSYKVKTRAKQKVKKEEEANPRTNREAIDRYCGAPLERPASGRA
jgi:hypothetical protein